MTTYSVKLHNAQQARQSVIALCEQLKPHLIAGQSFTLEAFDGKTRAQEKLCHSCYRDLARDCAFNGIKAGADDWKDALKLSFYQETKDDPEFAKDWERRKPRMIPALNGDGWIMTSIDSSGFTKRLYAAYITFIHATGDARGVNWSPTSLGREWSELAA